MRPVLFPGNGRQLTVLAWFAVAALPFLTVNLNAAGDSTSGSPATEQTALATQSTTSIAEFQPARVVAPKPPLYPRFASIDAREGWVLLDCVVDASGVLTDVTVRESSGQRELEETALRWMRTNQFEPARVGGQPIESSISYKTTFLLRPDETGARFQFIRQFRAFERAIKARDRAAADALLAEMDVSLLYEDAYYHYARYMHAVLWGDDGQRIDALRFAIAHESRARYLPSDMYAAALRSLFVLELQRFDIGAAMDTYELFTPEAQAEPAIANVMSTLRSIETDARSFTVEASLGPRGNWSTRLLKPRFRIDVHSGSVAEFRLRCDRR